jgi:hypothetical protein
MAWGAVVAMAYAALGVVAYIIGPGVHVPNTPCAFSGTGSGRTAQGDKSTFFIVFTAPPTGIIYFTDEGPASPLQLRDRHISTVTCTVHASAGNVTETVGLRSGTSHALGFRIDLRVPGGTGAHPTIRVRTTDGYDSGTETLTSADVAIKSHGLSRQTDVTGSPIQR